MVDHEGFTGPAQDGCCSTVMDALNAEERALRDWLQELGYDIEFS